MAPTFAILAIPKFRCPDDFEVNGWGNMSYAEKTEEWQIRIREVQGAICVSSIFQVIFGYFGNIFCNKHIFSFILKSVNFMITYFEYYNFSTELN